MGLLAVGGVSLGVIISLAILVLTTDNPVSVPLKVVYRRAAFGLVLYLLAYSIIGWMVFAAGRLIIPLEGSLSQFISAAVLGLTLTHSSYITDYLGTDAAQRVRYLLPIIVSFRNATRGYLAKIIDREERKVSFIFLQPEYECAITRLYEYHLVSIAHSEAQKRKRKERERVFGILHTRDVSVKFKLLLRFLGCEKCVEAVNRVEENPSILLSAWPASSGDRRSRLRTRRQGENTPAVEQRSILHGRRKIDSPYVRTFIVDGVPVEA